MKASLISFSVYGQASSLIDVHRLDSSKGNRRQEIRARHVAYEKGPNKTHFCFLTSSKCFRGVCLIRCDALARHFSLSLGKRQLPWYVVSLSPIAIIIFHRSRTPLVARSIFSSLKNGYKHSNVFCCSLRWRIDVAGHVKPHRCRGQL